MHLGVSQLGASQLEGYLSGYLLLFPHDQQIDGVGREKHGFCLLPCAVFILFFGITQYFADI